MRKSNIKKRTMQAMALIALALCAVMVNVRVEAKIQPAEYMRGKITVAYADRMDIAKAKFVKQETTPEPTPAPTIDYNSNLVAVNVFPEPTPEPTPEPVYEEPVYTATNDGWTYYGNCRITFYCSGACCCGAYASGYTASGTACTANRTVACGSDIPFGTELLIDGQVYVCEDRGVGSGQIDIFVPTHDEALRRGLYYTDVYVRW